MKSILAFATVALAASVAVAAPSGPKKESKSKADIVAYNAGVDFLMEKNFTAAAGEFAEALSQRERFAEAHNNLAYALRKQGPDHYAKSLEHYNRAIELEPDLAEAYMYRGVLLVAMGNLDAAKADHGQLEKLQSPLATELEHVIESGSEKSPEQFFGVTEKL